MNPGDGPITEAIYSLARGKPLPEWAIHFKQNLYQKSGTLFFKDGNIDLPMAFKQQKRDSVKKLYFTPSQPSTIQPITDDLRKRFANITKRNVTLILRSVETYQLNFQRRVPPKIASRTILKQPGVIAMDMFFPSRLLGWKKLNCLTCMDTWSRFCRIYALRRKDYASTKRAMSDFLGEFASFGHLPRRILSDRGTDLAPAKEVIEKYRQYKDGDRDLVIHSQSNQPVLIVEALNAQVQRRMQVFRTAGITNDPAAILADISDQINNQKRPERGNLTPLQLLGLNKSERSSVNLSNEKQVVSGMQTDLKVLKIGQRVRYLTWGKKEQLHGGLGARFKGFAPKWSQNTYTVVRKIQLRRNPGNYHYDIGLTQAVELLRSQQMREALRIEEEPRSKDPQLFLRHELLWIPQVVDREI